MDILPFHQGKLNLQRIVGLKPPNSSRIRNKQQQQQQQQQQHLGNTVSIVSGNSTSSTNGSIRSNKENDIDITITNEEFLEGLRKHKDSSKCLSSINKQCYNDMAWIQ
eukprot:Pgem_evm1s18232